MRLPVPSTALPWLAYGLSLLILELVFGRYFSAGNGIGHDYAFFMPTLLDGYYWFLNNGPFSAPWFSPAFCAGIPAYPDPQSLYYSPLQFLSFVFPPPQAAHLTLTLYASLGYLGMYLLCHQRLGISMPGAILAAVLWMLNGFVTHRMIVGHVSFVGIALIPLIAWCMSSANRRWQARCLSILAAGALLASWIYSGLAALMVPALLSVACLLCVVIVRGCAPRPIYLNTLLAALIGIALAASKLVAATSLMSNLPRSQYPLMGFDSVPDLLLANLASIGLPSAWAQSIAWPLVQNRFVYLDVHEWTQTLTPVPLLLIAAAGLAGLISLRRRGLPPALSWKQSLHLALLTILVILPLSVQFHDPHWGAVLKQIPVIKSTSNPFRWTLVLLPLICVMAAFSLDKIAPRRTWLPMIPACLAAALCISLEPREFYLHQGYDPQPISQAFERARASGFIPRVEQLNAHVNAEGDIVLLPNRNDLIIDGISQAYCYNPLFGYGLENLDLRDLRPGAMTLDLGGHLNMKNPACYVFPAENHCGPGDHYRSDQLREAERLSRYQPIAFERPLRQRVADLLSGLSLAVIAVLAAYAATCLRLTKK